MLAARSVGARSRDVERRRRLSGSTLVGAAAQGHAGERTGVLAPLHEDLAVDDRRLVAATLLHVASGAAGEVVHVLGQRQRERVELDAR